MDIVELIAQTGGTLGLAVFAIFMLNRVWELRLEEAQRHIDCQKLMSGQVREALDRNTEVMTRLVDIVERLERT